MAKSHFSSIQVTKVTGETAVLKVYGAWFMFYSARFRVTHVHKPSTINHQPLTT